ncbi:C-type lectin domain family 2 member B-like [Pyxicephalus adspersus]|uniref:C-type lectin domain family 2 member B-like n=1 Tax=Pyxicephalus adspersus TaxID=30357 RepID=UPI003B58BC21
MRGNRKHKDPKHPHGQPTALLSLGVTLKAVEISVIIIIIWNLPCNNRQEYDTSLPKNTSRTPSSTPKCNSETSDKIKDLCTATGNECKLCPLNWVAFGSKCYFFSEDRGNWSSSRKNCQMRNADILCMEDSAEEKFISEQVSLKNGHFWVGLKNLKNHTNEWIWESGKKYKKKLSVTSNEHECATFGREMSAESCYNPNKWICEKNMTTVTENDYFS